MNRFVADVVFLSNTTGWTQNTILLYNYYYFLFGFPFVVIVLKEKLGRRVNILAAFCLAIYWSTKIKKRNGISS